jgi:hypothetical protein
MFVLSGFGKLKYTFDSQRETDELMRKLAMDISFLIRLINPSRVIFTRDDKSWRKGIFIEENEGYKGQRKLSKFINWDNIYKIYDEFMDIVVDNGMIVSKIATAEADDLIALWTDELLYNQKQHVVAVSGDEDIRQLVKKSVDDKGKPIFATVFNPIMQGKNPSRKLYVSPNYFNEWILQEEEADIWNMNAAIDVDKNDFRRIRDTEKIRVEETDGNLIALKKIFCGDDGDNIPAIYTWMTKTAKGDDKEVRITKAKYEKILESLRNSPGERIDCWDLIDRKDKISESITKIAKQKLPFKIEDRLERQIKLVVLNKKLFPSSIVEKFEETKGKELIKPRPEIGNINMNVMLQGTRYVKTSKGGTGQGTESSIFKETDRLSNKFINLFNNKQLF